MSEPNDPFSSSFLERLKQASKTKNMSAAANALFGSTVDKYSDYFDDLKEDLKQADIDILYRTYVSKMFFYSTGAIVLGAIAGLSYSLQMNLPLVDIIRFSIGTPIAAGLLIFGSMYIYPSQKAKSRKKSIDSNLPFALNHLGAIASSGISPTAMFQLLNTFEEYGGISKEAGEISRRVNVFGEDLTTALREVAERSPSDDWSEVLYGIISTIETGGSLKSYLEEKADEAIFEYNMEKEKEIERLSTYASFYTAILIAAPVFLVVVLAVMNLLGGQIAGFAIRDLMWMGMHVVIPVINGLFVIFLAIVVD